MGCDIHIWSESKVNGKWLADDAATATKPYPDADYVQMREPYEGRNYGFFGLLSEDVRRTHPPGWAFPQKGLPDEMSQEIQEVAASWDSDGHSHNYLTIDELKQKATQLMLIGTNDATQLVASIRGLLDDITPAPEGATEQRVVFWFDN